LAKSNIGGYVMGNLYEVIIDKLEEVKKETSFKDNNLIELGLYDDNYYCEDK
jgi:hypothetical protein